MWSSEQRLYTVPVSLLDEIVIDPFDSGSPKGHGFRVL